MIELQTLALSTQDMLTLSMVALLGFALGMIVTILFMMARREPKTSDIETDFSQEVEESTFQENPEAAGDQPAEAPPRELWEKDPDWWRK